MRTSDTIIALAVLAIGLARMHELSLASAYSFREAQVPGSAVLSILFAGLIWERLFQLGGLYRRTEPHGTLHEIVAVSSIAFLALFTWSLVVASSVGHNALPAREILLLWGTAVGATIAGRHLTRHAVARSARRQRVVVVVGSGPRGHRLFRHLRESGNPHYRVLGFVDTECHSVAAEVRAWMIGTPLDLEQILMRVVVDEVLIALPIKSHYATIQQVIRSCERLGVQARYPLDLFETSIATPVAVGAALTFRVGDQRHPWLAKRVLDVTAAATALIVLAPLFLLIAIAIRVTSPGPAIFTQERCGYQKRRFRMYKFRTMVADAERRLADVEHLNEATGPAFKIRNDPRVTPLGRLLRRSSLDELPQLFNVVRGEMSLVGPRPMSVRDVELFTEPWLMRRFSVRPGLTCLWQISDRSNLSFDYWIALDLAYIDRWSILLDTKIILRTIPAVLRASGVM